LPDHRDLEGIDVGLTRFRANSPHVHHHIIDDEVVLINLETGFYYSAEQTGADIWELLVAGKRPEEIIAHLQDRHGGDRTQVESLVQAFLSELRKEQLITEIGDDEPAETYTRLTTHRRVERLTAGPVILYKYGEMAELIIHGPDSQFYKTDRYRPQ
jgi:hypothetical protein